MLVAEKMNRVSVIILREDLEGVLEEIARLGVLHPARLEEVDEWAKDLASMGVEQLSAEYAKRQRRLQQLLEGISSQQLKTQEGRVEEIHSLELGQIDQAVAAIETRLEPLLSARAALVGKQNELKSLLNQLGMLTPSGVPIRSLMQSTFLSSAIGVIHESQLPRLRRLLGAAPSVVFPYQTDDEQFRVICVMLRRDKETLEQSLREVGFRETALPQDLNKVSSEVESGVARDIAALETELSRVTKDIQSAQSDVLPELLTVSRNVEAALLLLSIENYCKVTDRTCLFAGWAPRERTDELVATMRKKTKGRAVVKVVDAETIQNVKEGKIEVPVLVKLPLFLKPFRMLVEGYGIPSYRMIDPTLFVAVTFLLMFGMMFGDVGHGLVLVAGGILLVMKSGRFHDIGRLAVYCGASSAVFGMLYGSVFGLETVIPTLWVKPLENITTLFKVAIGFGVVVVSLGLVLNMINSLRMHAFLRGFFDESGPLIAIAYWAGVGVGIKFFLYTEGPFRPGAILLFIVLPMAVFFAKGPILRLAGRQEKAFPEGVITYLVEGLVEVMEILMGYLANTVSFIRVAAFGLAHAGLFVAVFSMADAVSGGPGGKVTSWLVLIVGNVIVILLEGLVVTIQALRLEYYEFFGKFFKGVGSKYEPVGFSGALPEKAS